LPILAVSAALKHWVASIVGAICLAFPLRSRSINCNACPNLIFGDEQPGKVTDRTVWTTDHDPVRKTPFSGGASPLALDVNFIDAAGNAFIKTPFRHVLIKGNRKPETLTQPAKPRKQRAFTTTGL